MRLHPLLSVAAALTLALAGCSSPPGPPGPEPAAPILPPPSPSQVVSGAPDTSGAMPGSPNALYVFRFKQTDPSSDRFTFRDRDVSFYFRPSPTALYFKVENLQGRPITIDWDDSKFYDVNGRVAKVAHGTTRWRDRFAPQGVTLIGGLQQYGDYVLSMDDLLDPAAGGDGDQPHRPIVPEDSSAPTYSGRTFGVDLVFNVEERPRTYSFRFQVSSAIPR